MFDEDGTLLGAWHLNDAHWRGEYMNGFLYALNIEVKSPPKKLVKELTKKLNEYFGY